MSNFPELEPLILEAEKTGKWLRSHYQGVCLSPKELRRENSKGYFLWGPINWELIDPKILLKDAETAKREAEKHNAKILGRINK